MTLIAAFRSMNNGILLCSDRQEDDGISKKAVDKIYRIRDLRPCEVFIAGSGPSTPIKNACIEIHECLKRASNNGTDVLAEHRTIIESSLKTIHKRYAKVLQSWPINMIIVVAGRAPACFPLLYHTDIEMLSPESLYIAHGSGKPICDYLASHLYKLGLTKQWLVVLATFIFRETGESASGVGCGADMVMIQDQGKTLELFGYDNIKKIEQGIPDLMECVFPCWETRVQIPDWFKS